MTAFVAAAGVAKSEERPAYPQAERSDHTDDYFGTKVSDPYRWLEAIDSAQTQAWIDSERAFTAGALARLPERASIAARLRELWDFPHFGVPLRRGSRLFFSKNDGLENQAVWFVQEGPEARVLLDPNTLSKDGTVAVRTVSPTHDGRFFGYALAVGGSDWVSLHVRDVQTGQDLPDVIDWVKFSGQAWTHDNGGFYYSRYPQPRTGDKLFSALNGETLYYHRLGTAQSEDKLIFKLKEHPHWRFGARVSDDGRYLVLHISQDARVENAIFYADLGDPKAPNLDAPVRPLLDRFDAEYSYLGGRPGFFYVETTLGAPRGRVIEVSLGPGAGPAKTLLAEGPEAIDDIRLIGGTFVVATLHDAQSRIGVYSLEGELVSPVDLPGPGSVSDLSGTPDDPECFFSFTSYLNPPTVLSRNVRTGASTVFEEPRSPFDRSAYETRQVFYASKDGTRIPMFITARKGLKLDGKTPAWLYGYGGFNIATTPAFNPAHAYWLESGGVYAEANLRGGGEYGQSWHLAGTKERKQNVFEDFIAAADFLVSAGYTSRDRLMIQGRSNGGLLIGAVLNQRPDLAAVAVPQVGVMDMLRYHTFTIGAAWAADYGTSADPQGFRYLDAYSPVHNIRVGARYPAVFITTGDHDDRVFPGHSFKYAAQLQYAVSGVTGAGPVLIRIDSRAGHGGSSGTAPVSKTIEEWADILAFARAHLAKGP